MSGTHWTCWHLHVPSPAPSVLDAVLLDAVVPTLDELCGQHGPLPWFFVRYWQRGPHLRLRVGDVPDDTTAVAKALESRLEVVNSTIAPEEHLGADGYRAIAGALATAGEGGGALPVERLRKPGLYQDKYEPEYARYGGEELMSLSESLFHQSSRLTAGLVATERATGRTGRSAAGLTALLAGLGALDGPIDRVARFAEHSCAYWTDYVRRALPGIDHARLTATARAEGARLARRPDAVPAGMHRPAGAFARWADALRDAVGRWGNQRAAEHILRAHLHMTCNRLGLGLDQEPYLWTLLATIFRDPHPELPANHAGRE